MKGYLKFKDIGNIETIGIVKDVPNTRTIAEMLAFAVSVKAYINAGIVEYGLIKFQSFTPTPAGGTPSVGSNVKNKGRCHFTYQSANGETRLVTLWIPAPNMNNYELIEGVGYRMVQSAGEDLQAMLAALTGISDLLFSVGVLDYSESDKGSRNGACVLFQDEVGNTAYMSVPQPISLAAMQTFVNALNTGSGGVPYSAAASLRGYFAQPEAVVVPDSDPMATATTDVYGFASVERRAKMKFTYNEGTVKRWMTFALPSIKYANVQQEKDQRGYRVLKVIGDAVSLAITALYGSSVRATKFKRGLVDEFNLQTQ